MLCGSIFVIKNQDVLVGYQCVFLLKFIHLHDVTVLYADPVAFLLRATARYVWASIHDLLGVIFSNELRHVYDVGC